MIKDSNYYQVDGWMITKLCLSGNDLICFAIIYGFSQNQVSKFEGSLNYIAEFMSCSPKTAKRCIDKLLESNLIYKLTQGKSKQTPSAYRSNVEYNDGKLTYIHSTMDKMTIVKNSDDYSQNDHSTMDKMSTNNNINNNYYNNSEKKDINSVPSFISKEKEDKPKRFSGVNPSKEEVEAYIKERNYHISADEVIRYYTDRGRFPVWRLSNGNLVKDWKRCCGTFEDGWKRRNKDYEDKRKDFSVSAGRVLSPEAERERQRSLEQMRMLEQRRKERERNAVNE